MPRITDEMLINFAAGNLPEEQVPAVQQHLDANPNAARLVRMWREAAGAIATDDSTAPPEHLLAAAKAIYDPSALPAAERSRPGLLQQLEQIVAELVFDSRVQPAGLRYVDTGRRVQLSYETEDLAVDLQAQCNDDQQWSITGQVQETGDDDGADVSAMNIILQHRESKESVQSTQPDKRGMFSMVAPAGEYELMIETDHRAILVPDVRL